MQKTRAVIVISPKITARPGLCTIVPLSMTPPDKVMPYHMQLTIRPVLPTPYKSDGVWLKGDMLYAVSHKRLHFIYDGKNAAGKRRNYYHTLSGEQMQAVRRCVLHGLGMSGLTKYL